MRCAPRCRARAHGLCSCVDPGRGRPEGLPVGDHPLVGALVLGGDLLLGSALIGLEQPMAARAASLVARGAEQQPGCGAASRDRAPARPDAYCSPRLSRCHAITTSLRAVATVAILLARRSGDALVEGAQRAGGAGRLPARLDEQAADLGGALLADRSVLG